MSDHIAHKLAVLIVIGMAVQIGVIGYVFYSGYQRRVDTVIAQRKGCERGKLDREDNAAFQRAQKEYINKVVLAKSVREDVKTAARDAVTTFDTTSRNLTVRSKISCKKVYPDTSLFP